MSEQDLGGRHGRGVQAFVERHRGHVSGVLSGFDRLRLQGTLRTFHREETMSNYLRRAGVLWKDFKPHLRGMTQCVRDAAGLAAQAAGCQMHYLRSATLNKARFVGQILRDRRIGEGLVSVLSVVEPCRTWFIRGNRADKKLHLKLEWGKCTHLYFHMIHPLLGLMHMRLQTWFPFLVQFCINGREWLSRQMDARDIDYTRDDNCFGRIADLPRAQELMDEQVRTRFSALPDPLVRQYHPAHQRIREVMPVDYCYTACQSEHATDIMFKSRRGLGKVYPSLVQGSMVAMGSEEVLRFPGRKHPGSTEVQSDCRRREPGVRIKHWVGENSLKLHDKGGVLRSEVTINQPRDFKVHRRAEGRHDSGKSWRILRRSVADMPRRAQVCRAASERHFEALARFSCDQTLCVPVGPLCRPVRRKCVRTRALRPFEALEMQALRALNRTEFCLHGLRHRDLRDAMRKHMPAKPTGIQRAARTARVLRRFRAHGLPRKAGRTHRYYATPKARKAITALLSAAGASVPKLIEFAT
jgi:hypothetical protein